MSCRSVSAKWIGSSAGSSKRGLRLRWAGARVGVNTMSARPMGNRGASGGTVVLAAVARPLAVVSSAVGRQGSGAGVYRQRIS